MAEYFNPAVFGLTPAATVDANVVTVLGTAPTESAAGRLAAALTKFGDVATPVLTAESVNQTADVGTRVPHVVEMAQVGGAGVWYVVALGSAGTGTGQFSLAAGVIAASGNWNTTTPPTVGQIDTQLSGTHGAGAWGASSADSTLLLSAEIATVTSQTVFTLATGSDKDNSYHGQTIVLLDDSNSDYPSVRYVVDYVGLTRTVTISAAPDFTLGADDSVRILAATPTREALWSSAERTLTQTAAQVTAAVAGSTLTVQRGDTLSASFTGLGNISARTKLWVTGKKDKSHPDTAAVFKIEESAGLEIIAGGTATTAGNGSITVTNATTGALTVALAAVETAKLDEMVGGHYDIQMLTASGVQTLTDATLVVTQDVTRATS